MIPSADPPDGVRSLLSEDRAGLKKPTSATSEVGSKFLQDRRPVLWVGAGASVAAGYPGTGQLVRAMAEAADDSIDAKLSFFEVATARSTAGTAEGIPHHDARMAPHPGAVACVAAPILFSSPEEKKEGEGGTSGKRRRRSSGNF